MTPENDNLLLNDLEPTEQPSKTYKMHTTQDRISGHTNDLKAVEQAIYKIINTERYQNLIYSWNYGIELVDLYGMPLDYSVPELKRRITEALTQDDRIRSVDAFAFTMDKGKVHVTFTAHTSLGDVAAGKEVTV